MCVCIHILHVEFHIALHRVLLTSRAGWRDWLQIMVKLKVILIVSRQIPRVKRSIAELLALSMSTADTHTHFFSFYTACFFTYVHGHLCSSSLRWCMYVHVRLSPKRECCELAHWFDTVSECMWMRTDKEGVLEHPRWPHCSRLRSKEVIPCYINQCKFVYSLLTVRTMLLLMSEPTPLEAWQR